MYRKNDYIMILTHYYIEFNDKYNISTTSITESNIEEQHNISKILSSYSGRALRRFDNYDSYLCRRKQTELQLYNTFIKSGGRPTLNTPLYFVVGENEQLKQDFGSDVKTLQIDTDIIAEHHISFTIGDSMGLHLSNSPLKIYLLQEIVNMIDTNYNFQSSMSSLKPYHRYIEAQLWDKQYFEYIKKSII